MLIEWSNEYDTGVEWLDVDHKHIVILGNKLLENVDNRHTPEMLRSVFMEFSDYFSRHIKDEQLLMKSIDSPDIDEYIIDHDDIVDILFKLSSLYDSIEEYYTISSLIMVWLINHLSEHERKFAQYIRCHGLQHPR